MFKKKIFDGSVIDENGNLFSGGENKHGQLGFGDSKPRDSLEITKFPNNEKIRTMSRNTSHALYVTENGKLFFSGKSVYRAFGGKVQNSKLKIFDFFKDKFVKKVSTGFYSSFVFLWNSKVYVSGFNKYGQLGINETKKNIKPTLINESLIFDEPNEEQPVDIQCGYNHSLLLSTQGKVYSAGFNQYGQLGLEQFQIRRLFTKIPFFGNNQTQETIKIIKIACGFFHSYFLDSKYNVYSLGYNNYGQLGLNHKRIEKTPKQIKSISNVIKIETGERHTFFVTKDLEIYAVGGNRYHQLGINGEKVLYVVVPTKIGEWNSLKGFQFVDVYCSRFSTHFVTNEGKIFSCGLNQSGECFLGYFSDVGEPIIEPKEVPNIKIKLERIGENEIFKYMIFRCQNQRKLVDICIKFEKNVIYNEE